MSDDDRKQNNFIMETKILAQELAKLNSSTNKSFSKQIFALLPDIETAIRNGISIKEIVNALNKQGLNMSMATFNNALYRHRKRNKAVKLPNSLSDANDMTVNKPVSMPNASTPSPKNQSNEHRLKTSEELAAENPGLSMIQLAKLEAEQYRSREWKLT